MDITEEATKQLHLWFYNQKVEPKHNIIDKETFILFEFFSLDIPDFLFKSKSKELFCYLITKECSHKITRLLKHMSISHLNTIVLDVNESYFELYLQKIQSYDTKLELFNKMKNINTQNYAFMFFENEFKNKKNIKIAKELFWKNWIENKNTNSLHNYADILRTSKNKNDEKKARELYLKNWEENKNSNSLNVYAYMLEHCIGGEKDLVKARELYWKNWEENKNSKSLHNYADMLLRGLGGEKDEKKARELYLKNWEENKDNKSLHNYAYMLEYGFGGEKDLVKARELYWENWKKNANINSITNYINMLKNGLGGEKNLRLARHLETLITN